MEKKNIFILIAVVLVILGVAGYFYWQNYLSPAAEESAALENAVDAAQAITESASKGVLPNMDTSAVIDNVAEGISNTNPFSDIKTIPFQ